MDCCWSAGLFPDCWLKGQHDKAKWSSPVVTLCVYVLKDINGNNQTHRDKWMCLVCRNTNANSGFTGNFNKPHQKHNVTLQNSMFVSPSYKSQHEIYHNLTLLSYKSPDNTLNISHTQKTFTSQIQLNALSSMIDTATLFIVFGLNQNNVQ